MSLNLRSKSMVSSLELMTAYVSSMVRPQQPLFSRVRALGNVDHWGLRVPGMESVPDIVSLCLQ